MKLARLSIAIKPNTLEKEGIATKSHTVRKRKRSIWLKLFIALLLVGAGTGGYFYWQAQQAPPAATVINVPVTTGNIDVNVESSGSVQANQVMAVPFKQGGQVTEALVEAGDTVTKGQPLARIDDKDLRLKVQKAEVALQAAQEKLADLQEAPTSDEIVAAEAAVTSAQSALDTAKEPATSDEIAAARNALKAAQNKLEDAKAGPSAQEIASADAILKAAQQKLADLKAGASASDLSAAQNAVTIADARLTTVKAGASKADLAVADAAVKSAQEKVTSAKSSGSSTELATAQANLLKAQENLATLKAKPTSSELAQAQNDLASAKEKLSDLKAGATATELAQAESAVLTAQDNLTTLKAGPDPQKLSDAQTAFDKAQTQLDTLLAAPDKGKVAEAQLKLSQARTALDKLKTPASGSDLASAQLNVAQSQSDLDAARLAFTQATVTAPFDGVVTDVKAVVGNTAMPNSEAVSMNDISSLHLDIDLSESDVARVQKDQPVTLTFDAISGQIITGTVTSVASVADTSNNVVTYLVQVGFNPGDAPVKVGMSANAAIRVDGREGVLQVPSRAITTQGRNKTISILYGTNKTPVTVRVETGLTNGAMTEIVSCLDTNNQCLRQGDTVAMTLTTTTSSGQAQGPGGMVQIPFGGGGFGGGMIIQGGPGGPGGQRRQGP